MQVRVINAESWQGDILNGKVYDVVDETADYYCVHNEIGNSRACYAKARFEAVVATTRNPMLLPTDPIERKGIPITTGAIDYFPLALAEVAKLSKAGNDQHNPGQPLHWDKSKSTDHADTIGRHLIDRGKMDSDGQRHSAKLAWRALALLQTELEAEKA